MWKVVHEFTEVVLLVDTRDLQGCNKTKWMDIMIVKEFLCFNKCKVNALWNEKFDLCVVRFLHIWEWEYYGLRLWNWLSEWLQNLLICRYLRSYTENMSQRSLGPKSKLGKRLSDLPRSLPTKICMQFNVNICCINSIIQKSNSVH